MISTIRFDIISIVKFRMQWEGCVAHTREGERREVKNWVL
jgi:hypothetical protein